ncbi:MAG: hypothetical protein ACPGU7_15285, partial [Gammaproteobacteria bacterium]
IDGAGSSIDLVGSHAPYREVQIGGLGDSSLTIQNGASVTLDNEVRVGEWEAGATATAALNVDGAGSGLSTSGALIIGNVNGAGTVTVSDQADLQATEVYVGGRGQSYDNYWGDNFVETEDNANGTLNLSGGATLSTQALNLSGGADSDATVNVSGVGTELHFTQMYMGVTDWENGQTIRGDVALTVSDGASVTSVYGVDFYSAAGSATAITIDGAGSSIDLVGSHAPYREVQIGGLGDSSLTIQNGASVTLDNEVRVGEWEAGATATAALNVDGAGSGLSTSGALIIGNVNGAGTVTVSDQADLQATEVYVGGRGQSYDNYWGDNFVETEDNANGTLNLSGGATLSTQALNLSGGADSDATVNVSGVGTELHFTQMYMGVTDWENGQTIRGDVALTVSDGASVTSVYGVDFYSAAGSATAITIDGAGSSIDLVGSHAPY